MSCRDLLCVIDAPDGALTPAFHQALALARAGGDALTTLVVARLSVAPGGAFGSAAVGAAIHAANDASRAAAATISRAAEDAARGASPRLTIETLEATLAEAAASLARRGRCADLIVVDRPGGALESREALFEAALFETGRPVLVATPERTASRVGHIALAWDGSRIAARALGDALALFPAITQVDVLVVESDKTASPAVAPVHVARHLARRGVDANVINIPRIGGSVSVALDQAARAAAADCLVLGGFGHSRLREFVLGGVTRDLARAAAIPLLFSH